MARATGTHLLVIRIGYAPPGVARNNTLDAAKLVVDGFEAPETAAAQRGGFRRGISHYNPNTKYGRASPGWRQRRGQPIFDLLVHRRGRRPTLRYDPRFRRQERGSEVDGRRRPVRRAVHDPQCATYRGRRVH